jgi:UDP-N-acetyl-D-mannosaminuronic acid dehydrogenase
VAVIRILQAEGIEVVAHDPFVRSAPVPQETLDNGLQGADCLLVLTDHDEYRHLTPAHAIRLMRGRIVYDTRNVLDHGQWRAAGFSVRVLGGG